MKNCGRRFHNEVAKFRFLNELIKVVSPKVSEMHFHQPVLYMWCHFSNFFYLFFLVSRRQSVGQSEDESHRDPVQLDRVFARRGEDLRSLSDAEVTG